MFSSDHPAVLVVGAGPAGLIAAFALKKNSVPTRIIERRESVHGGIRGTFIQPRSIELLASVGVLDEVLKVSVPPYTIGVHGAGKEILSEMKWAEEADESPGTPYRCGFNVNQSVFERVLREQLEKKGVVVETGVELVGIEQTASAARARLLVNGNQHEEEFDYIVAADGARGSTRKALDVPFVGETKESDIIFTANVECHDVDREHWHRWGSIDTVSCLLKPVWPPPSFQIQALGLGLPKPLPQDTESIQKFFNDSTGSADIKLKNMSWASEWRANTRMAEKFRVGRVFLVGDTAHCHSPAGGQGMNSGMQDALNIAWKLALVHKGLAYPSLLDTYEVERMPVIAEMLAMTSKLHKLAFASSLSVSALGEHHAGASAEQKVDHMFRPKKGLQLGVNCRWSPIVLDGRDTGAGQTTLAQNPYGHDSAVLRPGLQRRCTRGGCQRRD